VAVLSWWLQGEGSLDEVAQAPGLAGLTGDRLERRVTTICNRLRKRLQRYKERQEGAES
jgi:hypothetical protein